MEKLGTSAIQQRLLAMATTVDSICQKHGIPISSGAKRYSMDANMLHTSFEGSELEDPGNAPDASCHERCVPVEQAPDTPEIVSVDFERGNPVAVNGEKLSPAALIDFRDRFPVHRDADPFTLLP